MTTIAINEKPILFSGSMVREILEGRKTQTRTVVKSDLSGYPSFYVLPVQFGVSLFASEGKHKGCGFGNLCDGELELYGAENFRKHGGLAWQKGERERITCPYGKLGDRLWVRETWAWPGEEEVIYRAAPSAAALAEEFAAKAKANPHYPRIHWKPSIHMARKHSRLTLEVVSVKVERVQDISEADAKAEGSDPDICHCDRYEYSLPGCEACANNYRRGYESLWESTNAKRGFGWKKNPWVWAISFKRIQEFPGERERAQGK